MRHFACSLFVMLLAAAMQPCAAAEYKLPPTRCYLNSDFVLPTSDGAKSVLLAGAITRPRGTPSPATILMITGTGPHTRDQMISGVPMFGMIGDVLARAGYTVVRTDSRGAGKSTIDGAVLADDAWLNVKSSDRYRDNERLLSYLKSRKDLAGQPLILLGHSEGAMIAARLAANHPDLVAGTILLSDSAIPGRELFAYQRTPLPTRAPPQTVDRLHQLLLKFADFMARDPANDAEFERIATEFADAQKDLPKPLLPRGFLEFNRTKSPFHAELMTYDPYPDLSRLRVPTVAIYGSADEQAPAKMNVPVLAKALSQAANPDVSIDVVPDDDHFFLRFKGKRVDQHVFGEMRVSADLKQTLLSELQRRWAPAQAYCTR